MSVAVFVVICVVYYFLYYNYINKRLAEKCKKRYMPHPTTTFLYLVLLFSIIFNVFFYAELNRVNKEKQSLKLENNSYSKAIRINEIDSKSPYAYYRDIITSNDSYGYKVTYTKKNDFNFYFAQSDFDDSDDGVYYPEYICYIRYNGDLKDDDIDVTTEYIYNEDSGFKTSGSLEKEIMILSRELEKLPQQIKITIRERGNKLEEGNILSNETFDIYSVE
jgi:hypothetical protein